MVPLDTRNELIQWINERHSVREGRLRKQELDTVLTGLGPIITDSRWLILLTWSRSSWARSLNAKTPQSSLSSSAHCELSLLWTPHHTDSPSMEWRERDNMGPHGPCPGISFSQRDTINRPILQMGGTERLTYIELPSGSSQWDWSYACQILPYRVKVSKVICSLWSGPGPLLPCLQILHLPVLIPRTHTWCTVKSCGQIYVRRQEV